MRIKGMTNLSKGAQLWWMKSSNLANDSTARLTRRSKERLHLTHIEILRKSYRSDFLPPHWILVDSGLPFPASVRTWTLCGGLVCSVRANRSSCQPKQLQKMWGAWEGHVFRKKRF